MIEKDNKDIENVRLKAEIVRLHNKIAGLNNEVSFLNHENRTIEKEVRDEYESELALVKSQLDEEVCKNGQLVKDNAAKDKTISELKAKIEDLQEAREVADAAKRANVDYNGIIKAIQNRMFNHNSDSTRFLNGVIDPDDPRLEEMGFEDVVRSLMEHTDPNAAGKKSMKSTASEKKSAIRLPKKTETATSKITYSSHKRVWTATELKKIGVNMENLPDNARIVKRKSKDSGLDTWFVQIISYEDAKVVITEYEIARCSTKEGMANSKRPEQIIKGNPVAPSFARFYLDSKFNLGLSENRILEMLKTMKTSIPQSTLNNWMHQIMETLRLRLEPLMLEAVRRSYFTHNDEVHLLVRSRESKDEPFKYNMEYIHAALSLEKKLVVMLYKDGSRDHSIQEELIFRGSDIKCFLADKAKMYETIEKDLEEYHIVRASCWFHFRHYLVDGYVSDSRLKEPIMLVNGLFYIEKESARRKHTPEQRLRFRLKYSVPIVNRLIKILEGIRLAGNEYGQMVHRAVNYFLNDKEAFLKFLRDGRIEMHNNAIERMFRHIAIGRRNWLHAGSHFSAENIAFMFSLLESCKLNGVVFGKYIEDILTRIMHGEIIDESCLPNKYVACLEEKLQNNVA